MTILVVSRVWSQPPPNNTCSNAEILCPSVAVSGTNRNATAALCATCEDNYTLCFNGINTVWYQFTTNMTGGSVSINFSNVAFIAQASRGTLLQASILAATTPCDPATYTPQGNCEAGAAGGFTLTATGLLPATTYYVVVNGALNGGATLPAEATFDIMASGPGMDRFPGGTIAAPGGTLCPQQAVTFTANLVDCIDTSQITWRINGTIAAVTTGPYWQTSGIQDGDVVSMECSCNTDCPVTVTSQLGPLAVDNLTVNAGSDQVIANGATTVLLGSTNGTSYFWTPASTLGSPASLQTVAIPTETTTYFLTASNALCSLSDDVVITILDQFTIPGSFSPNGDGINDKWVIDGIDAYPNALVTVYDRWGQEIAEIVGYSAQKAWDGTRKGKPVTDGVFFYIVDLNDSSAKAPFKGSVTVIR